MTPKVVPAPRCLNNWSVKKLLEAVLGKKPEEEEEQALLDLINKIHYDFQNMGITPKEKAMNIFAINLVNAVEIISDAVFKKKMQLEAIEVAPIPFGIRGRYRVNTYFFDPENLVRARRQYSCTVDLRDVCPVMVGEIRHSSVR